MLTEKRECVITCMMDSGLSFIATDMSKPSIELEVRTWGGGGGGCSPQKNQKTKPIYQFWCSDWFF